jgi:hypothetical protein
VRNCRFDGSTVYHFNEDEGTTDPYTGDPSRNLTIAIYRNVFAGGGLYQGGNNDAGVDDPGNTFLIFGNTFLNTDFNMGSPSGSMQYYDLYVRNNVFVGAAITEKSPAGGHVHVYSHNGFYGSGAPRGTAYLTSNPLLDGSQNVTSTAFIDAGTAAISPTLSLPADASDPLGYLGSAPDIGRTER